MTTGEDRGDELFGEEEFVNEVRGAVELRKLAFLLVGASGQGDYIADATEEAEAHRNGIVTSEVRHMKIEEQNIGGVLQSELQGVVEISGGADDVSGRLGAKQVRDDPAEGDAVVDDQNADGRFWDGRHV